MSWDTVIGLEVHTQLLTKSKLFSGAATTFGAAPNTRTSLIDAALPGTLPTLNAEAVRLAMLFGKAIGGTINDASIFERKNYFYPDLPKGYQISQFKRPIVSDGMLDIHDEENTIKNIYIERAHLEEDAGKLIHDLIYNKTAVDLNRAGIPLLEIVTTPCLASAFEVIAYLKKLHQLLRFNRISDGNMQEGSFRCDVNISLKPKGSTIFGTRVELKNLNSFRFIQQAIICEQKRQQQLLERGELVLQETRLYNPDANITAPLRSKEEQQDYRYFPDPDLLPITLNQHDFSLDPLIPDRIRATELKDLGNDDAEFLLASRSLYELFSAIKTHQPVTSQTIVNWLKGPWQTQEHITVTPAELAELLIHLERGEISHNSARKLFDLMCEQNLAVDDALVQLKQDTPDNSEILTVIAEIITRFPQQVTEYHQGRDKLLGFFTGQIMQALKGKGEPAEINMLIKQYLQDHAPN